MLCMFGGLVFVIDLVSWMWWFGWCLGGLGCLVVEWFCWVSWI